MRSTADATTRFDRNVFHGYSYNQDGLRDHLRIEKNVSGSDVVLGVTYEYDNLNRLTQRYSGEIFDSTSLPRVSL